jgi:hypothetical protein
MKICGFAFCRQAHLSNLRICNSGISPRIREFTIWVLKKVCMTNSDFVKVMNVSLLIIAIKKTSVRNTQILNKLIYPLFLSVGERSAL